MNVPPRSVTLFFNHTMNLYRRDEEAIARAVAETIRDRMPPPDETADLECRLDSPQPREVDQILVHRVNSVEEFDWKWTEASRRVENAIPLIESAIARKIKVASTCFQKCNECWLLIVAGEPLLRASGNIRADAGSLNHVYRSPFTRTYLLDFGRGSLTLLNSQPNHG
jgi:hypothetical protein